MTGKHTLKAPAKINIGLRVLSKRKDGFHNIETIFYPISLYDHVSLRLRRSDIDAIEVKVIPGKNIKLPKIKNEDNICYKAAALFLKKFKIAGHYKVEITINKNIPVGAGLGGGSSDAAAVLKIMAKHFRLSTKQKALLPKIALALGSDVPFFMAAKPAYAQLRGEKLTPLPNFIIPYKILVVNPGIHVSTPWAFNQLKVASFRLQVAGCRLQVASYRLQVKKKLGNIKTFRISEAEKFTNDFERVVFKKYPAIEKIKDLMYECGAEFSLMSGSGSTVYGFFKKEADLRPASKKFAAKKYLVLSV
jgi:4-diphosphocytidyl-2-C-methyl-D-erythritol kinase